MKCTYDRERFGVRPIEGILLQAREEMDALETQHKQSLRTDP